VTALAAEREEGWKAEESDGQRSIALTGRERGDLDRRPAFHLHSIAHAAPQASGRAICCSSTKVISR
jgi:hypothetical protein